MTIDVPLKSESLYKLSKDLRTLEKRSNEKMLELVERLASMGATKASLGFSRAIYQGDNDVVIEAEKTDDGYVIKASGESVLFIEFGAGATYGYGHPDTLGKYGPGTYPSTKGNWNNPKGWYYPKDSAPSGEYNHTYGNPPNAVMYNTADYLEQEMSNGIIEELKKVAEEVFNG